MNNLKEKYNLSEQKFIRIKKQFQKISSNKSCLSKEDFLRNLGLMGIEQGRFLSEKIFSLMEGEQRDNIDLESFTRYIGIQEMAYFILDQDQKGYLRYDDFVIMVKQMVHFWNYLTGDKVKPHSHFSHSLYIRFVKSVDDNLTFPMFLEVFIKEYETIFDLFDFLEFNEKYIKYQIIDNLKNKNFLGNSNPNKKLDFLNENIIKQENKLEEYNKQNRIQLKDLQQDQLDFNINPSESLQIDNSLSRNQDMMGEVQQIVSQMQMISVQIQKEQSKQCSKYESKFKDVVLLQTPNHSNIPEQDYNVSSGSHVHSSHKSYSSYSLEIITQLKRTHYSLFDQLKSHKVLKNIVQSDSEPVLFGREQWNMITGILIGVRKSLNNIYGLQNTLTACDFTMIGTYTLIHRKDIKNKEKHYFYDYAPNIFHKIRGIFGITPIDFLRSLSPEQLMVIIYMNNYINKSFLLKGQLSCVDGHLRSAKANQMLFTSWDNQYLIKSINHSEFSFLLSILRSYYEYIKQQPTSLLLRVLGVYQIVLNGKKIYLLVMDNIMKNVNRVVYDLKGSKYKRTVRKKTGYEEGVNRKDMDYEEDKVEMDLEQEQYAMINKQIRCDTNFLRLSNSNNYSLLLGICDRSGKEGKETRRGDNVFTSRNGQYVYQIGIVDILTDYKFTKKFENTFKLLFQGNTVSCIPPDQYADRFCDFMLETVFK